jgi:hypothetical protein
MSKPGKPRKAPKVKAPSRKKPNFMRENFHTDSRKSPQAPMKRKRLSK